MFPAPVVESVTVPVFVVEKDPVAVWVSKATAIFFARPGGIAGFATSLQRFDDVRGDAIYSTYRNQEFVCVNRRQRLAGV